MLGTLLAPFKSIINTVNTYFTGYARYHVHWALKRGIKTGRLTLTDNNGTQLFGNWSDDAKAKQRSAVLNVPNHHTYVRIWLSLDLGFSEAYMLGECNTPDLKAVLDLWLDNREAMNSLSSMYSSIARTISGFWNHMFAQTLSKSTLNCVMNYDMSNDLFQSFLSEEMMYSCAYWGEEQGGVRGDLSSPSTQDPKALEGAQRRKVQHMLKRARIRPGDRLLEFGSGWGNMAMEAARMGCTVDTLTLSVEQKTLAEKRIKEAGLESKITVHFLDYRKLPPEFEKAFDAFVSVEMVEAVGLKYLELHYKILDWALKSDRASVVIAATTQPEWRYQQYQATDFTRAYFWPGVFATSPLSMQEVVQDATKGRFNLSSIDDITTHYPRTLREWWRSLERSFKDPKLVESLIREYPDFKDKHNLDTFARRWHYMIVYSEVGFARFYTGAHIFTWVRPENIEEKCD